MLDQSFSAENFFKIFGIENRKGSFNKKLYSQEYLAKHQEAKEKYNNIISYRKLFQGVNAEQMFQSLKVLNEQKDKLDEEKDQILLSELEKASDKINQKSFVFSLSAREWNEKTVYSIEKNNISAFYAMKQLQYNLRKTFKVKQANRFEIVKQVKTILEDNFPKILLRTDIKSFYENIPQSRLKAKIYENPLLSKQSKKLINSLLYEYNKLKADAGIVEEIGSERGIPRGAGISAYLAEFYMRDIDNEIRDLPDVTYYARYVDDIIIIFTPQRKEGQSDYKEIVKSIIESENKYELKLNETKTQTINLIHVPKKDKQNFQFLGYKFTFNLNKFHEVLFSDNKIKKIKKRIFRSFSMYKINKLYNNPSQSKWLLIHQISFLTGNTRLIHNKSNILVGIYYSNNLIADSCPDLIKLDRFLHFAIKRYVVDDAKLLHRLCNYSFQKGFRTRRYVNFKSKRVPDFRSNTKKIKRERASGVEKIISTWKE